MNFSFQLFFFLVFHEHSQFHDFSGEPEAVKFTLMFVRDFYLFN
jgi:hypothetical protein